ncbi:MAG: peroxiredoxin family protein [Actinomycetes bacterium]
MVSVGDVAPSFTLHGVDGLTGAPGTYSLDDARGRPVVLVFYPNDNSPICRKQLAEYTEGMASFRELDATVLGISPWSVSSHAAFAQRSGGFGFPLLSDHDKDVARRYGVLGMLDLYRRCTFVLDADGIVRYSHRYLGGGFGYRPVSELVAAVAAVSMPSGGDETAPS